MICSCFGKTLDLSAAGRRAVETARLMVGVPDYDAYLAHAETAHSDVAPLTRQEFFRQRAQARYSQSGFRCC